MRNRRVYIELIGLYVLFSVLLYYLGGHENTATLDSIRSVSSWIFGIVLAFATANRHSRLNKVKHCLRKNDNHVMKIYHMSKFFGKKVQTQWRKSIDNFLIKQLDYKLEDFDESMGDALEFYDRLFKLKPKNLPQKEAFDVMIDNIDDLVENHKEVSFLIHTRIMLLEWDVILLLWANIMFCLFYTAELTIVSRIFVPLLGTAITLLLIILRELNNLTWQESGWRWRPLAVLFKDLGLVPYFPESILRRMEKPDLIKMKKCRMATFPKIYPDFRGKKVKLIKTQDY